MEAAFGCPQHWPWVFLGLGLGLGSQVLGLGLAFFCKSLALALNAVALALNTKSLKTSLPKILRTSLWSRQVEFPPATYSQCAYRSWKVMELKNSNFPRVESYVIRTGSLKVLENQPNGFHIFDPCTCFRPLRTLSLLSDLIWHGWISNSQVIGCEHRLRNDLYCVGWGVKLYSIKSNWRGWTMLSSGW